MRTSSGTTRAPGMSSSYVEAEADIPASQGLTRCGPLEKRMANQYSCLENSTNSMKRQKDTTLKDELPRLVGVQYATGKEQRNTSRRMKRLSQSRNDDHVWMCLVVKAKSNAVKNNIA